MKDKLLPLLSLCRKAGRVTTGFDEVRQAIAAGKARVILLSHELSPKRAEDIKYTATAANPPVLVLHIPQSMDTLAGVLGRRTGIIAVTDKGLADSVTACVAQQGKEQLYDDGKI